MSFRPVDLNPGRARPHIGTGYPIGTSLVSRLRLETSLANARILNIGEPNRKA
jgi:hypothetical protein